MIYLDYAANHPADPRVLNRFVEMEQNFPGNPNSTHAAGVAAREEMDRVTASIGKLLGAKPEEIIYTSGATEANNLAIKGIAHASRHQGRHIISTPLEHSSSSGALTFLQDQGYEIDLMPIDRQGKIDLEALQDYLREDTILLAMTLVDSELGTIQPLSEIQQILKDFPNCHLHVDVTQAIGRIPVSFEGMDTMSLALHKCGGLNGSGILVKKEHLVIEPQMHGGLSTTIYRSGTPALGLAASAQRALELALAEEAERTARVRRLSDFLRGELSRRPRVAVNTPKDSVSHILNVSVEGMSGTEFQQALSKKGICVSVKSACSAPETPSRAVFAVSRDRKRARGSWRISFSHLTTMEEMDIFLKDFDEICKEKFSL